MCSKLVGMLGLEPSIKKQPLKKKKRNKKYKNGKKEKKNTRRERGGKQNENTRVGSKKRLPPVATTVVSTVACIRC